MEDATRDRTLVVQLELHVDREPLSGCLRCHRGGEHAFVGWLGFLDALNCLQDAADETNDRRHR